LGIPPATQTAPAGKDGSRCRRSVVRFRRRFRRLRCHSLPDVVGGFAVVRIGATFQEETRERFVMRDASRAVEHAFEARFRLMAGLVKARVRIGSGVEQGFSDSHEVGAGRRFAQKSGKAQMGQRIPPVARLSPSPGRDRRRESSGRLSRLPGSPRRESTVGRAQVGSASSRARAASSVPDAWFVPRGMQAASSYSSFGVSGGDRWSRWSGGI